MTNFQTYNFVIELYFPLSVGYKVYKTAKINEISQHTKKLQSNITSDPFFILTLKFTDILLHL